MLPNVRDVAIILLAVQSLVILVLIAILIIQVIRLIRLLREEVLPILHATQETVGTVRGTATFVGEHVVQPVVKASSYAAGARQALATLFGRSGRNGDGHPQNKA